MTLHRSGTVTLSSLSPMDDRYSEALAAIVLNVGKADQDGFAVEMVQTHDIAEGTISKTYGDAPFTLEVSDKLSSGAVLYLVVSGNDVVSVDASSGAVILFKSGTAVVRAVSPSDDRYNTADAEVTIQWHGLIKAALPSLKIRSPKHMETHLSPSDIEEKVPAK